MTAANPRPLRLAEAAGVLSLATDLAMGQPLEHGLRTALLGLRMAQVLDLPTDALVTVYYTGVLHAAGCTAESEIGARFFGDELAARPRMMAAYSGSRRELIGTTARVAHAGSAPHTRAARIVLAAFGGVAEFRKWAVSHCDMARILGARMGLSEHVQQALRYLYERWDGKGMPGEISGEQIPLAVRLMHVAQDADMAFQRGGVALAYQVLADRSGSGLDPRAVAAFVALGPLAFHGLDSPSAWDEAVAAEPGPQPVVSEDRIDACLSAMADFADMKSMFMIGHSRGVADLAEAAAAAAGLGDAAATELRRAALVHDLGRVAVPVYVWAKPGALTRAERELVRLHCYHSERVLDAADGLRPLARLAGTHGERCDGSGYHRGSRAADLPFAAWLLAAVDCYRAMREPRPYRPALSPQAAAAELAREADAGRLDRTAVDAVLGAAGSAAGSSRRPRSAGQPSRPAGLSERECEVLSLVALGLSTKEVARRLGISPKTCDNHIQHVYGKVGVSSRAGATLFALEHGLIGPP